MEQDSLETVRCTDMKPINTIHLPRAERPPRRFRPCLNIPGTAIVLGCCLIAGPTHGAPAEKRPVNSAQNWSIALEPERGELDLSYRGRKLLAYAFATNQFKPYVKGLYTLEGDNVVRDAPPDHLHHHGLMYAIRVNGVNFWEERTDPGYQAPGSLPSRSTPEDTGGDPAIAFTQLLYWVPTRDRWAQDLSAVALLVERRTLTLSVNEAEAELALRWQSDFTVGKGTPKVRLSGATYHGLGMRLPEPFDAVARHQNSENLPYSAAQREDLTPARWSCVSHTLNGHEVMLALFNRPENKGDCKFFTMLNNFAYLSVTQGLDKAPLEYSSGDKFRLNYLLTVYSGPKSRDFLEARYKRWAAEKP